MATTGDTKALTRTGRRLGGLAVCVLLFLGLVVAGLGALAEDARGSSALARSGTFAFVVHHVDTSDVIADPEYPDHNVTAEGQFVIVKLTVTNVTDETHTFQSQFTTITDGAREYPIDESAWRYVGDVSKSVGPGGSIDAAIVFDVPDGVELQAIVLRDAAHSEGVSVAL